MEMVEKVEDREEQKCVWEEAKKRKKNMQEVIRNEIMLNYIKEDGERKRAGGIK